MKKVKKTLAVALTFAMTVVMVPQSALAAKKQVKLNKKSVSVAVGKTVKVKLKNNKKKVKWTVVSGKKNVALSKKGKTGVTIKGKRVGKAKVQAKIGKKKYVCTVTVTNKNKAQTTVAKKTAAPGNTTGTTAGKNTGSTAAKPTATPTPTPTPTSTPTPTTNPTVTLSADAQALKKIIEEQKKAGATVSEDLQDKDQYSWDDGTLIGITWNKVGLTGKLDLGSFASLKSVSFNNNAITELDVTKCTKLQKLLCNGNQLTKLDVTKCPELINLQCNKNQLSALDVTQCATLETLWCNRNQITSLDMSKSTELVNLYCDRNSLTELDLTNCTKLETVEADEGVTITGYTPAE
ncbi:putative uncharacterized protein [Clostridium sp. CAG:167]|nr:putative uncharacterized protein [Clostridium sp. CAG:167]